MGIWNSIKNFFRASRDEAAKKIADPIRDGKYAIKDSEDELNKKRSSLAHYVAENKSLLRKMEAQKANVDKYTRLIELAKSRGNDKDVDELTRSLLSAKSLAVTLKKEYDKNEELIKVFKAQLDAAQQKIDNAENSFNQLSIRLKSVELREELSSSDFTDVVTPFTMLEDLAKTVEQKENLAAAKEELTKDSAEEIAAKYESADAASIDQSYNDTFSPAAEG